MTDHELRESLSQIRSAILGVEGQGGLIRQVEDLEVRVKAVEEKVTTLSVKLLVLMSVLGALGQFVAKLLIK